MDILLAAGPPRPGRELLDGLGAVIEEVDKDQHTLVRCLRSVAELINLRLARKAMIPDNYINDIRIRLSYYKALSDIRNPDDVDRLESELKDQFGELPEPVLNLMGLMLIRAQCRELGVRVEIVVLRQQQIVLPQHEADLVDLGRPDAMDAIAEERRREPAVCRAALDLEVDARVERVGSRTGVTAAACSTISRSLAMGSSRFLSWLR